MEIVLAERGTDERVVDVHSIAIEDLWHIAQAHPNKGARDAILAVWSLAHDMRSALRTIAEVMDLPIHTKPAKG